MAFCTLWPTTLNSSPPDQPSYSAPSNYLNFTLHNHTDLQDLDLCLSLQINKKNLLPLQQVFQFCPTSQCTEVWVQIISVGWFIKYYLRWQQIKLITDWVTVCCSKEWGSTPTFLRPSVWSFLSPTLRLASPSRWRQSTLALYHSHPSCTLSLDVSSTFF